MGKASVVCRVRQQCFEFSSSPILVKCMHLSNGISLSEPRFSYLKTWARQNLPCLHPHSGPEMDTTCKVLYGAWCDAVLCARASLSLKETEGVPQVLGSWTLTPSPLGILIFPCKSDIMAPMFYHCCKSNQELSKEFRCHNYVQNTTCN